MNMFKSIVGGAFALGLAACGAVGDDAKKPVDDASSSGAAQSGQVQPAAAPAETHMAQSADREITPGPGPAIWLASDDDTKIYLFGTVHVLPPDLNWRTEIFDEVYSAADTAYFEADVDDQSPELAMLVAKLGTMPAGESLFDLLSDEEKAELIAAANDVNIPVESMSRLQPWLVAITLSMQYIISEGQDPNSGVEMILMPEARADGKTLRFFETAEQQLRFMADLPQDVQVEFLMEGVRQIKDIPHFIERMDQAWVNGDVEALGELIIADASMSAEVYEAMLVGRNRNWADELSKLAADEAGVFLVAVGAAHLAGEDSVTLMLEKGGLKVERVQ